jgi:exosome complex RNA-binding protein Rrp4
LIEVKHQLISKMKYHFIDLKDKIKAILGMNGLIWIHYSTKKYEQEGFNEEESKIEAMKEQEVSINNISKLMRNLHCISFSTEI